MKNFDFKFLKYIIVVAAFVIAVATTYTLENYNSRNSQYIAMDAATFPVVMMNTEDRIRFNALHGYAYEMDVTKMNGVITPLPADKKLDIIVSNYGEEIVGISYKVREIVSRELIEETQVKEFTSRNQETEAVLNIKNLVENGQEYMLEICLNTKKHEKIFYYTRIIAGANTALSDKLNFAINFNKYTYDKNEINKIVNWIEPKSGADNTNFGYANINSSLAHIGWGELHPTVESAIIPSINEISSETASISLDYVIAMPADDGTYFSCAVDEFYRVRITTRGQYLLNFERKTNEIFSNANDINTNRITMGIRSDDNIQYVTTVDGKYIFYVIDGTLWCYNQSNHEFTKVFSFDAQDVDGIRENWNNHGIKIMSVDEAGNLAFAVYGYMNRGTHEGNVGVGIYQYDIEQNSVKEQLFIPVDVPYDTLCQNIGELFYINPFGTCYVLLGNSLYSVDLTSMEYMEEATDLADGNYAVAGNATIIAFSVEKDGNPFGSINVFNMEQGGKYIIDAMEGESVRVLDFINTDLFYGRVKNADIYSKIDGTYVYPSYRMEVVDKDKNIIKYYSEEGIYIEATEVAGMRLNIYRLKKTDEGFASTAMDQLLNKDENVVDDVIGISSIATEKWKKELVMNIKKTYPAGDKPSFRAANEIFFSKDVELVLNWQENEKLTYYVYGAGSMQGEFETLGTAVNLANKYMGYVVGSDGKIYWRRLKSTSAQVTHVDYSHSIKAAVNEAANGAGLNLCGADVETVLYYVDNQIPVIGRTGADKYVLIIGYNADNIYYYDYEAGSEVTVGYGAAETLFAGYGNTFFAYGK